MRLPDIVVFAGFGIKPPFAHGYGAWVCWAKPDASASRDWLDLEDVRVQGFNVGFCAGGYAICLGVPSGDVGEGSLDEPVVIIAERVIGRFWFLLIGHGVERDKSGL